MKYSSLSVKTITLCVFTLLVVAALSTSSSSSLFVDAAEITSAPLDPKKFSIYEYVGGLWQANVHSSLPLNEGTTTSSPGGTKRKRKSKTTTKEGEQGEDDEEEEETSSLPSASSSSIITNVANAFSPDFTAACQIQGRGGFPTKVYGLPADVDLGSCVSCTLFANAGRGTILTRMEKEQNLLAQILFLPTSLSKARVYQVVPLNSYFSAEHGGDALKAKYVKHYNIDMGKEENKTPLIFVVTHKGNDLVEVRHVDPANVLSTAMNYLFSASSSSDSGTPTISQSSGLISGTNSKKVPVSHISSNLVAVLAKKKKTQGEKEDEKEEAEEEEESALDYCGVQITRFAGILTTQADVMLNVVVEYSASSSSSASANFCAVDSIIGWKSHQQREQQEAEDKELNKTETTPEKTSKSKKQVNRRREHLLLVSLKHFAGVDDEDAENVDASWYEKKKYGPSIGAFVLLIVMLGGKRIVSFILKQRGIDLDKFLKSTKKKNAEEIMEMRKNKANIKTGPTTDEEVSALQEEEQRQFVREMEASRAATTTASASASAATTTGNSSATAAASS